MDENDVRTLNQYIHALDQASEELEKMYLQKNIQGMEKVKKFINEIQEKISNLLNK